MAVRTIGPHLGGIRGGLALVMFALFTGYPVSASESVTNQVSATPTNLCPQFTLHDQFGKAHEFNFPRARPTILTVADKKGSEGIEGWAHPLAERFGDQIEIAGLADVSSVPGALRGLVRSKFKKAIQYPVMLDWDGDATQSFKYTRGKANVYLIAPDGRVLEHMYGEADAAAVNRLADQIKSLMTNTPQAQSALMQRPAPIDAECRRVRPRPGG